MNDLHMEQVDGDRAVLRDWRHVHNLIIPTAPLTLDEVRERAEVIETVVLESNPDGLRFAVGHGFVEVERYLLPGDTVPFIDLRLG
ncbi:hypothetical protein MTF65_05370 [Streptomyces sp. APSN-46.1]|uniref:hypothetical protein n=1 Tax=Streptomyces sp. APSN-46.1 TaxID=2929049 RepID=UPI001FB3595F|nr:hypothetical protein [Streptomyces sp. APSN-46.1]MCJ1676786.1 hypothetical protein [Streptomyces sp. APSN-46.1]